MPEGTVICILLVFALSAAVGMAVYSLRLARKYRIIETDRHCIYEGAIHHVVEIIDDRDDWFMRKARLHTDTYPYVVDVPISELGVTPLRTSGNASQEQL